MKRLTAFVLLMFFSLILLAKDKDIATAHYKVQGVCEQCKKCIEDAAYIKGVKKAEWNVATHDLVLIYRPSKTSAKIIMASIAHAGHDNELVKATDVEYKKLPSCCYYRTIKSK